MKTYNITIQATVTKTLHVKADNEQDAIEMAHDEFDVATYHNNENYTEDLLNITEGETA
jgi:hypothetical protein